MKNVMLIFFVLVQLLTVAAQEKPRTVKDKIEIRTDLNKYFKECNIDGSITLYDYQKKRWILSDSIDANKESLPASTFKIINLLIALETGVIKNENEIVKWVGKTDTVLYGYRPEIYKDMTVKEAFEVSAGWVFIELAKKIGKENYYKYLKACNYSNLNLLQPGDDFWNFGKFGVSPKNQINLLKKLYEGKLPFSKRNMNIVKKVMITEKGDNYIIRAKTGWTRYGGINTGWWVGYLENKGNIFFFATRITEDLKVNNPKFGLIRKEITKKVLKELNAFYR